MEQGKVVAIVLSVAVVGAGVVYLLISSVGEAMVYYKTVDELLAERDRFAGQRVRINGQLVDGSLRHKSGTDEFRFELTKNGQVLEVFYAGIIPPSMGNGREILVQGVLKPGGNAFYATEILTKCPSKYEDTARDKNVPRSD